MPNRDQWRGLGGADANRRDRDAPAPSTRAAEGRPFNDPGFRSEDARLNAALDRHDRERGRLPRPEYGHDQNYRPGYHEGGSRFGFFGLGPETEADPRGGRGGPPPYGPAADPALHPDIDQDFDPDYLHWRAQQMQRHDRDYADWRHHQYEQYDDEYRRFRAERRDDFHQRFQDWRAQREAAASASATAPDDKI